MICRNSYGKIFKIQKSPLRTILNYSLKICVSRILIKILNFILNKYILHENTKKLVGFFKIFFMNIMYFNEGFG